METDKEIISFSQSEKVKGGIIWATQVLNMLQGLEGSEQKGGEQVISVLIQMISQEAKFAKGVTGDIEIHFFFAQLCYFNGY